MIITSERHEQQFQILTTPENNKERFEFAWSGRRHEE